MKREYPLQTAQDVATLLEYLRRQDIAAHYSGLCVWIDSHMSAAQIGYFVSIGGELSDKRGAWYMRAVEGISKNDVEMICNA